MYTLYTIAQYTIIHDRFPEVFVCCKQLGRQHPEQETSKLLTKQTKICQFGSQLATRRPYSTPLPFTTFTSDWLIRMFVLLGESKY